MVFFLDNLFLIVLWNVRFSQTIDVKKIPRIYVFLDFMISHMKHWSRDTRHIFWYTEKMLKKIIRSEDPTFFFIYLNNKL